MQHKRPLAPPPHLMLPNEPDSPTDAQTTFVQSAANDAQETAASDDLRERLISALKTVYDPEIPVDIYELGLIYKLEIGENGFVEVDMTLTTPGCPVAGEMPGRVQAALELAEGVSEAKVNLVWEPAWDRSRMSEAARVALNMF